MADPDLQIRGGGGGRGGGSQIDLKISKGWGARPPRPFGWIRH